MKTRHVAVAAGLAISIVFGTAQISSIAFAEQGGSEVSQQASSDAGASGDVAEQLPAPADYDRADFYEEAPAAVPMARSARAASSSLSPVAVSSEMKYFTKYESHSNYRQGFSYGDGYNALGYYQFDRRYSLIPFLRAVYDYDPTTYAMLEPVLARASEVSSKSSSMYDASTRTLSELGRLVQDAWYAAYDANPAEFSALQDSYAYNSYYAVTERWLASQGIDLTGRADCVKGMVWGLTNMWGTGGVRRVLSGANLSNDMTDREFVTALATQMTDHIADYSTQTQYYKGWTDRYRKELNDCLAYISADEADEGSGSGGTGAAGSADSGAAGGSGAPGSSDSSSDVDGPVDGPAGEGSDSPDSSPTDDGADSPGVDDGIDDADGAGGDHAGDDGSGSSDGSAAAGDSGSDGSVGSSGQVSPQPSPQPLPTVDAGSSGDGASMPSSESREDADSGGVLPKGEPADGGAGNGGDSSGGDASDGSGQAGATVTQAQEEGAAGEDDGSAKGSGSASQQASAVAERRDAERMPQTSDLIIMAGLAAASTATLGATAIMAGRRGLKRSGRDD